MMGVWAALAAAVTAGSANCGYCDELSTSPPVFDFTIPDDGRTHKWTFAMEVPGATFTLHRPNTSEILVYRRSATGYDTESGGFDAPYRFDQSVTANLTTIFMRVSQADFSCNLPGPIGEVCGHSYDVGGNAGAFSYTGIPDEAETIRLAINDTVVPEPATWSFMLLGFGAVGVRVRKAQHSADQTARPDLRVSRHQ